VRAGLATFHLKLPYLDPTMTSVGEHHLSQLPDQGMQYRAVSSLAVASLVAGLLSPFALLDWALGLIPAMGILLGMRAIYRIRRDPTSLTGGPMAKIGVSLSLLFLAGGWSLLGYQYLTEVPEGFDRISFYDLQLDQSKGVPPAAAELDGKRVFIKGYIRSVGLTRQTDIDQFLLVRDSGECCFGPTLPNLGDMIQVSMNEMPPIDYTRRVQRVGGVLHVDPMAAMMGGPVYSLEAEYHQ
jgi:hypothetical protein